jgi:DNA-binding winged helix-turn-helix (wHTH) protein
VVLQRQPHTIFIMLITYPGQFVTRGEIQQELWPEGVVVNFEVSINQAISKLRHALNDSAVNPQFIETVGRRGYRLKVPVTMPPDRSDQEKESRDIAADPLPLQRLAAEIAAVCGPEERERLTATLLKLLHILNRMDAPCEEAMLAVPHEGESLNSSGSR